MTIYETQDPDRETSHT